MADDRNEHLLTVLAAQALLRKWIEQEEDVTQYLDNPRCDQVVIEATAQAGNPALSENWIELVRGDGNEPRRTALAEKCLERLGYKNDSLRKK